MPKKGMEKRTSCPDCGKRVTAVYNGSRWVIKMHPNKSGIWCSRGGD